MKENNKKHNINSNIEDYKSLKGLDCTQSDIDALNEKACKEILAVEQKYNRFRKPYYEKRSQLLKNIPNFWVTAFVNHPQISTILDDEDEECLHFLTQVEVEEFEDITSGYRLIFYFNKNPFFSNKSISKEFRLGISGDAISYSTDIDWYENMNILEKTKYNKKKDQQHTFFEWFADKMDPTSDEIAEVIKDDMWPNPLQYFLAPDIEVEENGIASEDEDEDISNDDEDGDDS